MSVVTKPVIMGSNKKCDYCLKLNCFQLCMLGEYDGFDFETVSSWDLCEIMFYRFGPESLKNVIYIPSQYLWTHLYFYYFVRFNLSGDIEVDKQW